MSVNLVVWKWSPAYDSAAKRRRLGVKYEDIMSAFAEAGAHPAMASHDFGAFERDVYARIGPNVVDGLYVLERSECARVFNLSLRQGDELVPRIGELARAHGLTSAEL
ncbi:MAG: hypothetical protein U0271_01760 [Polyangiaceae bacterium]